MLLIQVLLIQVSTIIIFDNLYVQNQSTTTAQALARTKTRMTTWLNSNFRGRWKEVSGPNVTLASNQWMIVMRIGKQGGNYDYHYWYRTNDGPWANKHGQTPSVLLPASDAESAHEIAKELFALECEQRRLTYFIGLLDKRQAEVIRLVFVDGIPTKEVAASFGLTYRTIDRIKRTAIENLAEMYAYSDQFRV